MMKFVFVIDTSPMMLLKSALKGEKVSSGMNYFQQSIFAIEEFINHRKRLNEFKTDKYYLMKSLSVGESPEACILSSCEHPYRHFQHQLFNLRNTRDMIEVERTLVEVIKTLNSNRFLYGSSNRLNGIQVTRIEPCNVIFFTANARKFKGYNQFVE